MNEQMILQYAQIAPIKQSAKRYQWLEYELTAEDTEINTEKSTSDVKFHLVKQTHLTQAVSKTRIAMERTVQRTMYSASYFLTRDG